jgi:hypothetical protein
MHGKYYLLYVPLSYVLYTAAQLALEPEFTSIHKPHPRYLGATTEVSFSRRYTSRKRCLNDSQVMFLIHTAANVECVPEHLYVEDSTASDLTLLLASHWVTECFETHQSRNHNLRVLRVECSRKRPTRLPELKTLDEQSKLRLRNSVEFSASTQYFTLSHWWGTGSPLKLLSTNKQALENEVLIPALPKTFQDAIRTTRKLGHRHLWFDSLCIIQDSSEDWKHESSCIDRIYKFAKCNIAGTSGADSSHGCFATSRKIPASLMKNFIIQLTIPNLPNAEYHVMRPHQFNSDVIQAPLNERAWLLQERVLSQRVLHFTESQVYFECRRGFLSESMLHMESEKDYDLLVGLINKES